MNILNNLGYNVEINYPEDWIKQNTNHYWKNLIRTMPYELLKNTYNKYILGSDYNV